MMQRMDDGAPYPLGAHFDGRGVNFALFSEHAGKVELCLFDPAGRREVERLTLPRRSENVWHGYVRGMLPGQRYGYRVSGPYEPQNGHRFNPNKLLIDPYARQLQGRIRWHDAVFGYRVDAHRGDLTLDRRDSAPMMPKCVVESPVAEWGDDRPPNRPMAETFIYETHVKGLTALRQDLPAPVRGSYAALGHPAVIDHLVGLGVTAVELMPIHAFVDDLFLVRQGLSNYWGYSTLAYFAPEPRYFGEGGPLGLRAAIRSLHEAGIEVILDVVYNHTAEGNHLGPTLSFRGIDNAVYYKHPPDDPRGDWDATGTGNTLNLAHPRVLQLVMDSLRHWVEAYHVDGFRFDLAPALARQPYDFTPDSGFLLAVAQDPVLRRVKMIAEPWDVGPDGWRTGGFPTGWSEWNDRARDTLRAFWRGDAGQLPGLAQTLTGSREIFGPSGRPPTASINYICSHDGFTLADLVSYNERRNWENGEDNRDGHSNNLSWNCGAEGATDDEAVLALRARQKRNMLATLFLSMGVPMLQMGDELSRSQGGNNNAYCQDNETTWLNWREADNPDPQLFAFVAALAALRRQHPVFRRRDFLQAGDRDGDGLRDVYWLAPDGREMNEGDWNDAERRVLGMQVGEQAGERFLLLLNAGDLPADFALAEDFPAEGWRRLLDTTEPAGLVDGHAVVLRPGGALTLAGRSLMLLAHVAEAA
jgi:glycogen operon protein